MLQSTRATEKTMKTMKTRTARSFRYLTAVSNTDGRPLKQWRRWTSQLKVEFQLHEVTKHGNTDIYVLCLCEYSHIVMNNHLPNWLKVDVLYMRIRIISMNLVEVIHLKSYTLSLFAS